MNKFKGLMFNEKWKTWFIHEEKQKKDVQKAKRILNGFIITALLISLGFLISEVSANSLNQAKFIAHSCSILLTVTMFLIVSQMDKNLD